MSRRLLTLIGVAAVFAAAVVLLKLRPGDASQAPSTPWGEPDLQGIWTNDLEIPLQRPAEVCQQGVLYRRGTSRTRQAASGPSSGSDETRRERGSEQDVGGAYNAAIFTTHKRLGRRTSLIVDPPDGKIPPLTPEAQKKEGRDPGVSARPAASHRDLQEQSAGLRRREVRTAITETGRDAPALPHGRRGRRARRRRRRHQSLRRPGGPQPRRAVHGRRAARFRRLPVSFSRSCSRLERCRFSTTPARGKGGSASSRSTGNPHLPSNVRQWWGDSRGRWEGNTLVVDVTNFTPKTYFQGSHENLHLVERWTRIDANTIEYAVTIEDPTTWTRPWTVKQEYSKQNDQANRIYYEPRCHEGNYGMPALLAGARAEERAFAERRGPDPATKGTAGCGGFAVGICATRERKAIR